MQLPGQVRARDDGLQSVQPLVATRFLAPAAGCTGGPGCGDEEHRHRPPLRSDAHARQRQRCESRA
jgi:hypothetical protein